MKLKKLIAAATAAALALSLTACGVNVTGVDVPENIELAVGETAKLDVSFLGDEGAAQDKLDEAGAKLELVWASSDEEVVIVTDGELKAVAAGEAEVTVSANDGTLADVCKVVVTIPVEGIEVPETLELVLGEKDSAEIGAKLLPEGATGATLTYVSSDEKIATVDENGKVTAVGVGECVITTIGTLEKSGDTIKEDTSTAVSEPVSENSESKSASTSSQASSTPKSTAQPTDNSQTVTGDTKVTVTQPEQSAGNSGNSNSGNTNSDKNNGSTATGGSNVSGGNGGNVTPPSNNGGSTGGNTTPPAPTQPDPTPAPAPDPTPAPQPDPEPQPPQPETPPEGGAIGGGNDGPIPGGGSDENNGGDATAGERPLPPA